MKNLSEYKKWYSDLKDNRSDDGLEFIWSLMRSTFVEYHYQLITENIANDFGKTLATRFDEHGEIGANFLLEKLDKNEDVELHGEIIFLLGKINKGDKEKILQYTRELTTKKEAYTRERAIIVLGWIGGVKELDILKDKLLNDTNVNCRAYSASSFMQLWFKCKSKKLRHTLLDAFLKALNKETNYFVISCIIGSIREIENNKFGISKISLDNNEKEKIDKASHRVKRYIERQLNKIVT